MNQDNTAGLRLCRARRYAATCGLVAIGLAATIATAQPKPVVEPQKRIDPGGGTFAANETTCSVSEANPLEVIAGWNDWRESPSVPSEIINSGFALTLDGGETWTDFLIRPPAGFQSNVEGDPMTAFDNRTGTIWAGAMSWGSPNCIYIARKDPGATEFEDSVIARSGGWLDKCWMDAGPRIGQPDSTRLYVAYNEGIIWSDDMGDTWTSPKDLGYGIGFLPRVGPNGGVYVAYYDLDNSMMLARSLDGGSTFTNHTIAVRMDSWSLGSSRVPGTFRVPELAYLDVDDNTGDLYAAYFDTTDIVGGQRNVDVYFTMSTDQGTTWSTPTIVNGDNDPPGDQFFCWIEADQHSRLHMVYFDSRHTDQVDDTTHGMFDAYYAYSVNKGQSWMEFRLTPNSWDSDDDGLDRPMQFIGDYLDIGVSGDRAFPIYLDTSAGDTDVFTNVIHLPAMGDTNGDGVADVLDLLAVLSAWGDCTEPDGCVEDLDGSGTIDVLDLLIVLANWT